MISSCLFFRSSRQKFVRHMAPRVYSRCFCDFNSNYRHQCKTTHRRFPGIAVEATGDSSESASISMFPDYPTFTLRPSSRKARRYFSKSIYFCFSCRTFWWKRQGCVREGSSAYSDVCSRGFAPLKDVMQRAAICTLLHRSYSTESTLSSGETGIEPRRCGRTGVG